MKRSNAQKTRLVAAGSFLKLYRLISLLIVVSLGMLCVPPVIAASAARHAFSHASNWVQTFSHAGPTPPQQRERRGIGPRPPETRADREVRVSRLKVNPSGPVRIRSREPILFTAIPTDAEGNSVHGLQATWVSSDSQVMFVKPNGQAIAGKPGRATLSATAGAVRATIEVTVVENTDREKFGRTKPTSTRRGHSIGVWDSKSSESQLTTASVNSVQPKRKSKQRSKLKSHAGTPFVPQRPPTEDPLPDNETPSLYEPGNIVGSPPGKGTPGAKTFAVATEGTETNGSQNFTFSLPIAGLSGRGIGISLSLVYNSQVWHKSTNVGLGATWFTYDVDSGWTGPGFRLGFGQIENQGSFGFTLTEADGTRRSLTNVSSMTFETNDGSFIRYVGGSTFGTLFYPDGTIVSYGAGGGGFRLYPTKITDRNGNYILINYAGANGAGPKISSIQDTLNRYINFYYASNGDLVTITAPGLGTADLQMMRFYYADVTLGSDLFDESVNASVPTSVRTLQYVYLPASADGADPRAGYKFEYSPYGMIRQITQFRGMTVSSNSTTEAGSVTSDGTMAAQTTYGYPTAGQSLTDVPKFGWRSDDWAGRTTSGSAPTHVFSNSSGTGVKISSITAPDETVTEAHTIDNPTGWDNGLIKQLLVKHGSTVLSTTTIDWENPTGTPRMASVRVTDDGSTAHTKATVFSYTTFNNVSVVSERDFTPDGSISQTELRRTETTYVTASSYINRRRLHLPSSVKVFAGGSNTPASRIDYEYDNYGTDHANLTPRNDIIMHDPAFDPFQETQESCDWVCYEYDPWWVNCINWQWVCNYYNPYDPNTDFRGNITSVTTYADAANASGAISHATTYDIAGNVMTAKVDCCQQKAFTYSGAGPTGAHDYAYVISLTSGNPAGTHLTTQASYDYNTGLLSTSTDANNHTTTNFYNPDSLRPDYSTFPDGGAVYFTYGDGLTADANGELHSYVQTSVKLDNNGSGGATRYVDTFQYFDGRGAVARALTNFTAANGWHTRDIEYDNMGRAVRLSNPYYSTGASSAINPDGFWTTVTIDHLGRITQRTMPRGDNNNSLNTTVQTSFDGIYTTATDQSGKVRRQKMDALGRIIRLDEPTTSGLGPTSSPAQATYYYYDVLDNLVRVNQGSQNRYFKLDSLSRVIRERHVEQETNPAYDLYDPLTGITSWSRKLDYNSHGLITDSHDARGVHAEFDYDDLNRLTTITYSDATPQAHYFYDNQTLPNGAPDYTKSNTTGRLLAMTYGSSTSITGNYYAYDAMGRTTTQKQVTGSNVYNLSYTYNHAGMLTGETYPSNRALTYTYDEGGRLSQVSDTARTFANSFQYSEHGGLKSETFGNGMVRALEYNRRFQANKLQLSQTIGSTTTVLQQYDYGYGAFNTSTGGVDTSKNNGQIGSITSKINGVTQSLQGFSYDELGRLANATEYQSANLASPTYSLDYTYDRYGNRRQSANATLGLPAISASEFVEATNRFINTGATPTTYDAAGNITVDTKFRNRKYEYNAHGQQTAVKNMNDTNVQTSVYDCGGQRVQTTANGVTRTKVFDIFGQNVADYVGTGTTLERENIYRGGQLLATETPLVAAPSALAINPSTASIALSWSAASGATNYRVERKGAGTSYASIGTSATTSFTDNGAVVGSAYLYRVCAADGAGNCTSGYTNIGLGARVNFPTDPTITSITDDPTGQNVTTMKAQHITELRTAVDAVRSLAGLSAATWTHSTLTPQVTEISKDDVQDLRDRLHDALTTLGIQTSAYQDATLAGAPNGTLIRAAHIRELRDRTTKGASAGGGGTSGGLQYVLSDVQGSTRAVMSNNDASSAVIARHDYLPFGEEIGAGVGLRSTTQAYNAPDTNRWKYGMTERDGETGLDHAWWRKHENLSGRWTSPDPYNRSMATADPQSFNRYSYVGNDPVNFIDPTGLVIIRSFISCGYALYDYWDGESWQTDIGLFCFLVTEISPSPAPEPGPGGVTPTQTKEECDPHFFKDTDTFKIGDKTFTGADLNVAARTVYAESSSGFSRNAQHGIGDDTWAERNAIASVMYNMLSDKQPTFNAVANNGRYQAVTSPSHNQKFKGSDIASGAYKNLKERDANGGGGDCNDLRASVDAIRRMVNNKGPWYDFDRFRGGRTPVGNSTVIGGSRFGYAGKTDTGLGPW